jgi:hypothetical protein
VNTTALIRQPESFFIAAHTATCIAALQGESDAIESEDAECYAVKLHELLSNIREDLRQVGCFGRFLCFIFMFDFSLGCVLLVQPTLPIIVVQIWSTSTNLNFVEEVRAATLQVAEADEYTTSVDAKGLELRVDNLHLSLEAQITLGGMLCSAAQRILA